MQRGVLIVIIAALAMVSGPVAAADVADTSAAIHPLRATSSNQLVLVDAAQPGATDATLTAYQWDYDHWARTLGPYRAYLGPNGFTDRPHESDGYTPVGQYNFTMTFGSSPDPGTAMPYRMVTPADHWVDDPASAFYNTYQHGDGSGRWTSAEDLSNYELAAAFDFNQRPVVPNGNSAIFLHGGNGPTGGCVAVDEASLVQLLRWLDPATRPQIDLGVHAALPPHPSTPRPTTTTTTPTTTTSVARVGPAGTELALSLAVSRRRTPAVRSWAALLAIGLAVIGAAAVAFGVLRVVWRDSREHR